MGIRCADHVTPLYPQKLALTSPTGGDRSVGIVRSRKATEFSLVLWIMWNNIAEPGREYFNMAHAHCMLDTRGYRHALGICYTYCFYNATIVARTRLDVTLPDFRNCNWCFAHHTLGISVLRHTFCFPIFPLMLLDLIL